MEERPNQEEQKKEIQIVPGSKKDLTISPVYDNLVLEKPEEKKVNPTIVIPEEKKTQE